MLAAFWEWYAKSGEEDLGTPAGGRGGVVGGLSPLLPSLPIPFISLLSFGLVQYRGQLWPLNSEGAQWLAALAAVKEAHTCLNLPPCFIYFIFYPSAPGSLVRCGVVLLLSLSPLWVLVLFLRDSTWQRPIKSSCINRKAETSERKLKKKGRWWWVVMLGPENVENLYKWQIPLHITILPVMQGITHISSLYIKWTTYVFYRNIIYIWYIYIYWKYIWKTL